MLERGQILPHDAETGIATIDVALYWHQWKLGTGGIDVPPVADAPIARSGLMEQIGQSLIAGARSALLQP